MKVLLIGGGGRESAIAHALKKDDNVELYTLLKNKNPGITRLSEEICLASETDLNSVENFAKKIKPDLAVIGPEAPL